MKKYLFCKYLFETYYIKQILYYYQEKEKKMISRSTLNIISNIKLLKIKY